MRNKKQAQRGRGQMVPMVGKSGAKGLIDVSTIPVDDWRNHHGVTRKSVNVNSLQSIRLKGTNTTLIRNGEDGRAFSVPTTDLEVAAVQILEDRGYTVTPTSATTS